MLKTLLCCLLALILQANPLFGVEGYKSLKFGMSLKEVKKNKICGWIDDGAIKIPHVHFIYCRDFKFNSELITAMTGFIDGKLLRVALMISYDNQESTLTGLKKKYGTASTTPSDQSIKNFYSQPNQELWYGFDDNTVYLKLSSDKFFTKSAMLLYTSLSFDKLLKKKQVNSLKDDL